MTAHKRNILLDWLAILVAFLAVGILIDAFIRFSAASAAAPKPKIVKADPKAVALSMIPKNYKELQVLRDKAGFREREDRAYVINTVGDLRWVLKYADNTNLVRMYAPETSVTAADRRPLKPIPAKDRF